MTKSILYFNILLCTVVLENILIFRLLFSSKGAWHVWNLAEDETGAQALPATFVLQTVPNSYWV